MSAGMDSAELLEKIKNGDRRALARAITRIESTRSEDQKKAQDLLSLAMPESGKSIRIAISGVPGVGKSTFIETLGIYLAEKGNKVAVLAVDPSSPFTGGSILGDKTRMEQLAAHPNAFIRPSPTGGNLGGVARKTREAMYMCEAAGFHIILIETVGVGQSEYEAATLSDFFLLLLLPGAGDALQGIKRGILELADLMVINKADGDNKHRAEMAQKELQSALTFISNREGDVPDVVMCSALEATGITRIWEITHNRLQQMQHSGEFEKKRERQLERWIQNTIERDVISAFWQTEGKKERYHQALEALKTGQSTFSDAVNRVIGEKP